uniref:Competence protein F homolog, phosphoribosyltransferase domain protein YhgH required for utilization of DNA as sole source of carbon and energy n=1 Tax=uncultured Armatimonadetes bacterium TaxID=157466 RepID=A0A6J4IHS4_9BACT|nr:Competence protein F homolog, phosphoribosyltransferase domain; protein YhgH required for utilization of DNA as sole source of carbon and energy [uncultured Armatimonadetes bacterium]
MDFKGSGTAGTAVSAGLRKQAKLAWDGVLDLVYPPHCLVCERHARPPLCEDCTAHFAPIPEPVCAVCGRPVEGDAPCRHCAGAPEAGGWGFDTARGAAIYEGALRHAIHRFKYGRMESLGEPLGAYLANRLVADALLSPPPPDLVIPVPIHASRERRRGFNQANVLAAPVAEMLGVPLRPGLLVRTRKTPPQVGLAPEARRSNLADAFTVPGASELAGRRVLLIDDVFTTGSTVSACARALKEAGAASVRVATLAAGG